MPPTVLTTNFPYDAEADPIQIGASGQAVYVVAADDDGDPVSFSWFLSREGFIDYATPLAVEDGYGSQVNLVYDPDLDGENLRCFLDDGQGNGFTLTWSLEVP